MPGPQMRMVVLLLMINNRHIRHDWQTFVEWEQGSVKTMCMQKSKPRLSGIPGITYNPGGSWCPNCIRWTIQGWGINQPLVNILANVRKNNEDERVKSLYDDFFKVVVEAAEINARAGT